FALGLSLEGLNVPPEELKKTGPEKRSIPLLQFLRFNTTMSASQLCAEFRPIAQETRKKWASTPGPANDKSPGQAFAQYSLRSQRQEEVKALHMKFYSFLLQKVSLIVKARQSDTISKRKFTKIRSEPIRSNSPGEYDGFDAPEIRDRAIFKPQPRSAAAKTLKPALEHAPFFTQGYGESSRQHAAQAWVASQAAKSFSRYKDTDSEATQFNESRIEDYNNYRQQPQTLPRAIVQPMRTRPPSVSPTQIVPSRSTFDNREGFGEIRQCKRLFTGDSGFYNTCIPQTNNPDAQFPTQVGENQEYVRRHQQQQLDDEDYKRQLQEQDEQMFLETLECDDDVMYPKLPERNEHGVALEPVASATEIFTSFCHDEPPVTDWDEFDEKEVASMDESSPKPQIPLWLKSAEFPFRWEVMRVALHCKVDIAQISLDMSEIASQEDLMSELRKNRLFKGKKLPPPSSHLAFQAARIQGQARGQAVMFGIRMTASEKEKGPLFYLSLDPLHLECGNRLIRRFGADRFINLTFPSLRSPKAPRIVRDTPQGVEKVIEWLVDTRHSFLERSWSAFFTHDRKQTVKGAIGESEWFPEQLSPAPQTSMMHRVVLFAENGAEFVNTSPAAGFVPPKEHAMRADLRLFMEKEALINWAVEPWHPDNQVQLALKLFSRLALSMSKTFATITLQPHQIIHEEQNIISPTGNVMNDGIGTMSKRLAFKIAEVLGLEKTPSGYQGRIGSAKGLWIIGTENPQDLWIKTYPSQRKWECSYEDDDHRTFEVLSEVRPLKSGSLNMQFIPVMMAQSIDPEKMKSVISDHLRTTIEEEMLVHKAMDRDHPAMYLQWLQQDSSARFERIAKGSVEFLGGLPRSQHETSKLMLNGGFLPLKQRFLFEIFESLVKKRSDRLKDRFKINIPQSTYAYMVVDFLGVLNEGEVHMGFSQSFRINNEERVTVLHGQDALVARSPAHFPSDIQRVKLVYHPSLRHLEDVVVFSIKGDVPLAHLLSGGDYDGDKAWVCWDPEIVENFGNAAPPPSLDLGLEKDKTTFTNLANMVGADEIESISLFLNYAFNFNMNESMLGLCTRYKEYLCYNFNSVSSPEILSLSTLLGLLVDQNKQGHIFTNEDWDEFRKNLGLKNWLPQPQYRGDKSPPGGHNLHILDHLKFNVAIPTINTAMAMFNSKKQSVTYYDEDLMKPFKQLEAWCQSTNPVEKKAWRALRDQLSLDIQKLLESWGNFTPNTAILYAEWIEKHVAMLAEIRPSEAALAAVPLIKDVLRLDQPDTISMWGWLKASKLLHVRQKKDVAFRLAGAQLQNIKAMEVEARKRGRVIYMTSDMYAVHQPDRRVIMGLSAQDAAAGHADTVAASQEGEYDEYMGDEGQWGLE
ncbi:hypothetical protein TD95_000778, partial [Thielaviopsis punctulata]